MSQRLIIIFLVVLGVSLVGYAAVNRSADIDATLITVQNATCNTRDGSITRIIGDPLWLYTWKNKYGVSVGNTLDLTNVGQGYYTLTYKETAASTAKTYGPVFVKNTTGPNMDDSNIQITSASCADDGGTIKGIRVSEVSASTSFIWTNLTTGKKTSVNSPDLTNASPGRYELKIFDSDACEILTSALINVPGTGMPDVDVSKVIVTDEVCNNGKGSITGVIIKNPNPKQRFTWIDEFFAEWGHSLDLTNVHAGIYRLRVDYENGSCEYISSTKIVGNTGAPVIDDSKAVKSNTFCDGHGAVEGLKVTGTGNFTYTWLNSRDAVVGHDIDLKEVPPDTYRFFVSDNGGCGIAMKTFFVMNIPPGFPFYPEKAIVKKSTCDSYGSVTGNQTVFALKYVWRDDKNAIVSTTADLLNAEGGLYTLEVRTVCKPGEPKIYKFDLGSFKKSNYPKFNVTMQQACSGQNTGWIRVMTDVFVKSKRWVNSNGDNVSTEDIAENLAVGTYQFYVTNNADCEILYGTYSLGAKPTPAAPVVNDVQIGGPGAAQIKVTGVITGSIYRLYDSEDDVTPIGERQDGVFNITAKETKDYYISQIADCESPRTKVTVNVGLNSADIPNTITPNGDGINDYWKINDIETHPSASVQIYTRSGKQVYQSVGYAKPFDGMYNGKALAAGIYYYMITINGVKSASGNLTIIR